jgi:hypothetical protein
MDYAISDHLNTIEAITFILEKKFRNAEYKSTATLQIVQSVQSDFFNWLQPFLLSSDFSKRQIRKLLDPF